MLCRKAVAATAVASLGLAGLLAGPKFAQRAAPEAILTGSYGSALADADTSWTSLPRNVWLSGLSGGPAGADKVIAAGDTITIAGKDGPQIIEVTGLEQVDGDRIGVPGVRFQLVTGHTLGSHRSSPVRFLFATDRQNQPPAVAPADRVL